MGFSGFVPPSCPRAGAGPRVRQRTAHDGTLVLVRALGAPRAAALSGASSLVPSPGQPRGYEVALADTTAHST
eukprot:5960002-Pyramimonas_sp.AAC.1